MNAYDTEADMLSQLFDENTSFFKVMTKTEMLEKLAEGRKQIVDGQCESSEAMEKEIAGEFGFAMNELLL